jgi:hypothetical protein
MQNVLANMAGTSRRMSGFRVIISRNPENLRDVQSQVEPKKMADIQARYWIVTVIISHCVVGHLDLSEHQYQTPGYPQLAQKPR